MTSEKFTSTNFSKCTIALRGGAENADLYIYFTAEQSTFVNPLFFKRTDYRRSYIIMDLNLQYNGDTVDRLPYYAVTSGHQVRVVRPSKS
jgi:hypothetical protein